MKLLVYLILVTSAVYSNAQTAGWRLVWQDEFDKPGLPDSNRWRYDVGGHGWGNNELQYYTAGDLRNARVQDGKLIIEARKDSMQGNAFTSARLVTKGKGEWSHGRVEVSARLPRGIGTWPAIWMLSARTPLTWPDDGEIDIVEHVGHDPGHVHFSIHTKKFNHLNNTQKTHQVLVPDAMDTFHVYAMEWNSRQIRWMVDGKEVFSVTNDGSGKDAWPFDAPFYLLLNIAVGGNWGGMHGVDDYMLPQQLVVDYVRVYQFK